MPLPREAGRGGTAVRGTSAPAAGSARTARPGTSGGGARWPHAPQPAGRWRP